MSEVRLDTKTAVGLAKAWVADQFAGESVEDIGLEEVKFSNGHWEITIGFSRPWDRRNMMQIALAASPARQYKVIVVEDATGKVVEMRNREAA